MASDCSKIFINLSYTTKQLLLDSRWWFVNGVFLPIIIFIYNLIQKFSNSTIQHFNTSTLQQFNNPTPQHFNNSTIQQLNNSRIWHFNNLTIQQFNKSTIQQFNNSTIQPSTIQTKKIAPFDPKTLCFAGWAWHSSAPSCFKSPIVLSTSCKWMFME